MGEESLLRALVEEVRDLRGLVSARRPSRDWVKLRDVLRLRRFGKELRKELYRVYANAGGTDRQWSKVLNTRLTLEEKAARLSWSVDEWKDYLVAEAVRDRDK